MTINLVKVTPLALAVADALPIDRIRKVSLLSMRGIRPVYDEPICAVNAKGRVIMDATGKPLAV